MTIDEVITLEDLKKFYEQEARKLDFENNLKESARYLDSITNKFELAEMQLYYIHKDIFSMEEQTNAATMALYNQVKAMASTTIVKKKK